MAKVFQPRWFVELKNINLRRNLLVRFPAAFFTVCYYNTPQYALLASTVLSLSVSLGEPSYESPGAYRSIRHSPGRCSVRDPVFDTSRDCGGVGIVWLALAAY